MLLHCREPNLRLIVSLPMFAFWYQYHAWMNAVPKLKAMSIPKKSRQSAWSVDHRVELPVFVTSQTLRGFNAAAEARTWQALTNRL